MNEKCFNRETGRYLGTVKIIDADFVTLTNAFDQDVRLPMQQVFFDEAEANKLQKKLYQDPEKIAMDKATTTKEYLGDALYKSKIAFIIGFMAFSLTIIDGILESNFKGMMGGLLGQLSGVGFVGGFILMMTGGLTYIKYKRRKSGWK